MTDTSYLMQYFLEHSPKESDTQKNQQKTVLNEKGGNVNKTEDAGLE